MFNFVTFRYIYRKRTRRTFYPEHILPTYTQYTYAYHIRVVVGMYVYKNDMLQGETYILQTVLRKRGIRVCIVRED